MGTAIDAGDVDLHAPSHSLRYLVIVAAAVALGLAVYGFDTYTGRQEASKLQGFDAFRAVYAEKCGVSTYTAEQPEVIRDAYVSSPPLRTAMDKERLALQSGASCDEVVGSLKRVGFALPAPGSAP